jgi:hypothetical protein
MRLASRRGARCAGLVLGAALVVVLLPGWRVPGGKVAPGADVSVTVNRTGELDVAPHGRLLHVRDLLPGRFAEARFVATNTAGTTLAVRVRVRADGVDLDEQLAVRVLARRRPLFSGTLGGLRRPPRRRLVLSAGASAPVVVRVWLPSRARAYGARSADLSLELLSEAAE